MYNNFGNSVQKFNENDTVRKMLEDSFKESEIKSSAAANLKITNRFLLF